MTYGDAISKYGSDKPDVRYGLEISNISRLVPEWSSATVDVEAIRVPRAAASLSKSKLLKAVGKHFDNLGENSPFKDPAIRILSLDLSSASALKVHEVQQRRLPMLSEASIDSLRALVQDEGKEEGGSGGDASSLIVVCSPKLVNVR